MKKIMTIIGTRPEIIKMSPILPLLDEEFEHVLVHSGQHYSKEMDTIFFEELNLKKPKYFLEVGSHQPAKQLGTMMERFEEVFLKENPDGVIVHGDTHTTLAGALVVAKHNMSKCKLIHIEAGARSGNKHQQEEINRKIVDIVTDLHFVQVDNDIEILKKENIDISKAYVVGNSVIDSCQRASELANKDILNTLELNENQYILMTMHRQENVDDKKILEDYVSTINELSKKIKIVYSLHPRTKKNLENFNLKFNENVKLIEPIGYIDTITLVKFARFCMTDSGGLQEEAAVLNTPTLILRTETEAVQYIECGLHKLIKNDMKILTKEFNELLDEEKLKLRKLIEYKFPENISNRIIQIIKEDLT